MTDEPEYNFDVWSKKSDRGIAKLSSILKLLEKFIASHNLST